MVKISNKPNVNGINNVSEDVDYSAKLIAREGKLFAGLITTRFKGFVLLLIFSLYMVGLFV